jgi:hypothetical protein
MIELILLGLGAAVVLWPSRKKKEYVIDEPSVEPSSKTPRFESAVQALNVVRKRIEDTDEWDTDETESIMVLMHALVRGSDK